MLSFKMLMRYGGETTSRTGEKYMYFREKGFVEPRDVYFPLGGSRRGEAACLILSNDCLVDPEPLRGFQ